MAGDIEPMIDWDGISYVEASDHEARPESDAYRKWFAENLGRGPIARPDAIVKKARKRFGDAFAAWLESFA